MTALRTVSRMPFNEDVRPALDQQVRAIFDAGSVELGALGKLYRFMAVYGQFSRCQALLGSALCLRLLLVQV